MVKITTSISYPSQTVPGRTMSTYISTPIANPTQDQIFKVLQEHLDELNQQLKFCDPSKLKVDITID